MKKLQLPSKFQVIFGVAKVNGGVYLGDSLPSTTFWDWPKETWLKKRLNEVREETKDDI